MLCIGKADCLLAMSCTSRQATFLNARASSLRLTRSAQLLFRTPKAVKAVRVSSRSVCAAAMAPVKPITFYDSGTCPYAQRVWLALEEKKLPYDTIKVDLANKSQEFKDAYAAINPDPVASAKVPIIHDGDTHLIESNLIVEYLDNAYPEAGEALLPSDKGEYGKVKMFVEFFGERFTSGLFQVLKADTVDKAAELKQRFTQILTALDKFLSLHGNEEGGSYFLGSRYSFAETSTTPFVRRGVIVLREARNYDIRQVAQENGLHRLDRWIQASLDRESNKKTGPTDEELISSLSRFVSPLKD